MYPLNPIESYSFTNTPGVGGCHYHYVNHYRDPSFLLQKSPLLPSLDFLPVTAIVSLPEFLSLPLSPRRLANEIVANPSPGRNRRPTSRGSASATARQQ